MESGLFPGFDELGRYDGDGNEGHGHDDGGFNPLPIGCPWAKMTCPWGDRRVLMRNVAAY
ncbi:hypothetical protein CIK58_05035 [Brevibacterium aurantiacum]|nr:hypothetical protein CIK58_05035 [Brevibacterium aurantiacum]